MFDIDELEKKIENRDLKSDTPFARHKEVLESLKTPPPSIILPGWDRLNRLIGGFRMREFTVLCGSTGSGKTTLLANFAKAFSYAGEKIFVVSVETGQDDFIRRVWSVYAGFDMNRGDPIDPKIVKEFANKHSHEITNSNLFVSRYEGRTDPEEVILDIYNHHKKKGCKVVFIDNLNFLLEVVSQNRQIEVMDKVTHDFIMLSKQLDVHIVMVMHPKKTEGTRVESEFDIKGSSTAVQEAHNVFLFNRPSEKQMRFHLVDEYDISHPKPGPYLRELIVRKLRRRGEAVGSSLWLGHSAASYKELLVAKPR